ncbi:eCIS core domain-containing protein [Chitinophaga lutea]
MSESKTPTAPARGLKAGKILRTEGPGQAHASPRHETSPFFATASQPDFFPALQPETVRMKAYHAGGKIRAKAEEEQVQAKCAECEKEELQRHPGEALQAKAEDEGDVQAKCADCEKEELQRNPEEDVQAKTEDEDKIQAKCADCEKEELQRSPEEDVQAKAGEEELQQRTDGNIQAKAEEEEQLQAKCDTCENEALQRNAEAATPPANDIQASLKVGRPDDPYEVEADRMAEQVMRTPSLSFTGGGGTRPEGNGSGVQRREDGDIQAKPLSGLQRGRDGGLRTTAAFTARLRTAPEGQPLEAPVRDDMESAFGADFGGVRIHTGTESAAMNREIGAQAFAHQNDIYFGENKYRPGTPEGRFLLAHELTHTVQQGAAPAIQRDETDGAEEEPQSWWDRLRNGAEYVLQSVLPEPIYEFYRNIKRYGLIGWIKETIFSLFRGLFNGLGFSDTEFMAIVQIFVALKAQIPAIIDGLSRGDCAPLFAAMNTLSEVISGIAGRIWDRVMNAIEPLRQWLNRIWDTYMAPAIDRITAFAGEMWERIKRLGRWIWDAFYDLVIRPYVDAWNWICEKLGFGDSSEGGFISWISDKLGEAWQFIRDELRPVIEPIQQVVSSIAAIIDMDAIRRFQEEAEQWLNDAAATATAMGNDDDAVANQQTSLRDVLLPALNNTIERIKNVITAAGDWVVEKVNTFAGHVTGFVTGVRDNYYIGAAYSLISWVPDTVRTIQDWAVDKVQWLFNSARNGMELVKGFMRRVFDMLMSLASTVTNILGRLGDFVLGPLALVPACIKDPIVKWLTEVVLRRIPIISEFMDLADKWPQIRAAALTVLQQVFVDGALARGLWTFFRNLLSILGIDPTLVTTIIAKAARNFSAIIRAPGEFLKNVWNVVKGGFSRFWDNIGTHLLTGALNWLFGEVGNATSVAPPQDFSIKSLLGYVMDLFGVTKENVYKRMEENPRIGPAKVKRIRQVEAVLTGALEWITVWIKEGPAGLLRKAQEKLNDLKEMIINGIISWITTRVSAEIMQRLATSADPLGIGATINTIILVYDAIKTGIAYVNRMLTIANQAMDNLAQIIAGEVAGAAEAFEELLGRATPVVVGFAVEVIIGPVGQKIQDIVEAGRKKVDDAIDWLINGALNFIDAILNALRAAADKVLGWLGIREEFEADDGETHTLSYTGTEDNATLMIASSPLAFRVWLDRVKIDPADTKKLDAKKKAEKKYGEIEKAMALTTTTEKKEKAKQTKIRTLTQQLTKFAAKLFDKGDMDEWKAPKFGNLKNGYATSMLITTLSKKKMPDGSVPDGSISPPTYRIINQRRNKGGSYYVLGHLLNHNIGGTGHDMKNLTPLTRDANSAHLNMMERNVKTAVTQGNTLEYKVVPSYAHISKSTKAAKDKVDASSVKDKAIIKEIIDNEIYVPDSLKCEAYIVNPKTKEKGEMLVNVVIKNEFEQEPLSYDLVGIRRATINLDQASAEEMKTIQARDVRPQDMAVLALKIRNAVMHLHRSQHRHFHTYAEMARYEINGKAAFTTRQVEGIEAIAELDYVKLYSNS